MHTDIQIVIHALLTLIVSNILKTSIMSIVWCCWNLEFTTYSFWIYVKLISRVQSWIIIKLPFWLSRLRRNVSHVYLIKVRVKLQSFFLDLCTFTLFFLSVRFINFLLETNSIFFFHILWNFSFFIIIFLNSLTHPSSIFRFAFLHDSNLLFNLYLISNASEIPIRKESMRTVKSDRTICYHSQGIFLLYALFHLVFNDFTSSNISQTSSIVLNM